MRRERVTLDAGNGGVQSAERSPIACPGGIGPGSLWGSTSSHTPRSGHQTTLDPSWILTVRIWPLGPHFGQWRPLLPGSAETTRVPRSSVRRDAMGSGSIVPNTIDRPSGSQHGSQRSRSFSGRARTSTSPPPAGTMRTAFPVSSGAVPTKRMCFPSGDHRGIQARRGGVVSWKGALPSRRPCHSTASGNETQASHCPSGEGSTYPTEDPPRKGSNRLSPGSKRSNSARRSVPNANQLSPSGRGPS
jgi:hypothetical protein